MRRIVVFGDVLILGIETSCDETSVAIVEDGERVLVNLIASQVKLHAQFGGVVPELASRAHIQKLIPMVHEALQQAELELGQVDALAVTLGPGLVGALLIGVETAKTLAFAAGKPLIPVHHVAAHLYSPFLRTDRQQYQLVIIEPAAGEQAGGDGSEIPTCANLTRSGG